ncbi:MAG: DUF1922 domain-containing protein [Nitrososphaerales archaeon]
MCKSEAGSTIFMREFMIVGCPICKNLQITTSKKSMKCKYCGRITNMNKLKVFYNSSSHKDALKALYQIREEKAIKIFF